MLLLLKNIITDYLTLSMINLKRLLNNNYYKKIKYPLIILLKSEIL